MVSLMSISDSKTIKAALSSPAIQKRICASLSGTSNAVDPNTPVKKEKEFKSAQLTC